MDFRSSSRHGGAKGARAAAVPREPAAAGDRDLEHAWSTLTARLAGRPVPPLVIAVGLGTGALLDALDRYAPATRVLAIEPDPGAAAALLGARDLEPWHRSGRLLYLVGPAYDGADQAWRIFPRDAGAPLVLVDPACAHPEKVAAAGALIERILYGVRANAVARRRFAPRYLVNAVRNIPAILAGSDVRALTDACRGIPAIVVAAGPSLDDALPGLREARDRALVIAVDTALRPLLNAGVAPHLVVALDPGVMNARHLLSLPECGDTWLVCESAVDRAATAPFDGRTFWFRAGDHHPWPWLIERGIDAALLEVWGSVITGAFQVALLAGCDPIAFVGADLAFTGGRPYARATTYEFDWAWSAAAGTPLEAAWAHQMRGAELQHVPDLHGHETPTTAVLVAFRDWLVARARRSGRRVVNATAAGILAGDGIEQRPLADILPAKAAIPPFRTVARRFAGVRPTAVAAGLREIGGALAASRMATAPLAAWREFSGDGFDPSALAHALDEAAFTLETRRGRPHAPAHEKWPTFAAGAASELLARLPEATTRLRAVLGGADALPPRPLHAAADANKTAGLVRHAWHLLHAICESVAAAADVEPLAGDSLAGPTPVSAMYAWHDTTRWAIEIFEGLLGASWGSGGTGPGAAYFNRPIVPAADSAGERSGGRGLGPHASHACVLLVAEWLRCLDSLSPGERAALERLLRSEDAGPNAASPSSLAPVLELPRALAPSHLARLLTGAVIPAGRERASLSFAHIPVAGGSALSMRVSDPERGAHSGRARTRASLVRPRILTDEGFPPSFVAYGTDRGAVCVTPNGLESVLVRSDGTVEPHGRWPRPVIFELSCGSLGTVAWTNGLADWPRPDTPYVMYTPRDGGDIVVEELPFRPGLGWFWRDRVYFACLPGGIGAWTGLASWAPGDPRLELPDPALWAGEPRDGALLLHPRVVHANGQYERRRLEQGWRWQPGAAPEAAALGPYGAASCIAVREGLVATAYPEADLIEIATPAGRLGLTCYWPHRVAWAGSSLLVSTVEREVLLFEDLASSLPAAAGPAPSGGDC